MKWSSPHEDRGMGRIQRTDWRDLSYLAREVLPTGTEASQLLKSSRYWNEMGWWGDQGGTPMCVAYAFAHLIEDGPVTHKEQAPVVEPQVLYGECKAIDAETDPSLEGVEGTLVRSGAEALRRRGWLAEYRWCMSAEEIAAAVLAQCPVVMGTDWTRDMFNPTPSGHLISPTGPIMGGHAYVLNGYSAKTKRFRLKNSWGRDWGHGGTAAIAKEDVQGLLEGSHRFATGPGEACLAVELKAPEFPDRRM